MKTIDISKNHLLIEHLLSEVRDAEKQKSMPQFRSAIERLGEILAIHASDYLAYKDSVVKTPFGEAALRVLSDQPVLYAIIRAGIGLQAGVSRIFPDAPCGFCTCSKKGDGKKVSELFLPFETSRKVIIISDPLMTTGASISSAINAIRKNGDPSLIIILNIISTPLALSTLEQVVDLDIIVLTCAIDAFTKGIKGTLPGLGDAGDLLYGKTILHHE